MAQGPKLRLPMCPAEPRSVASGAFSNILAARQRAGICLLTFVGICLAQVHNGHPAILPRGSHLPFMLSIRQIRQLQTRLSGPGDRRLAKRQLGSSPFAGVNVSMGSPPASGWFELAVACSSSSQLSVLDS